MPPKFYFKGQYLSRLSLVRFGQELSSIGQGVEIIYFGRVPGGLVPLRSSSKKPSPIARGVIFSEAFCCLLSNIIFPFPPTTGHLLVGEGECLRSLVSHFTYRRERISTKDFRQKHFHLRLLMDTFEANMQPIITN